MIARLRRLSISTNGATKDSLIMEAASSVVERSDVLLDDGMMARDCVAAGLRNAEASRRRYNVDRQL